MKKILFDLLSTQPINNVKFHGGGEYSKVVFLALIKSLNACTHCVEVFFDKRKEVSNDIKRILNETHVEIHDCNNIQELNTILKNGHFDVFFSGLPYHYGNGLIVPEFTKFIYTIHGLREIEKPYDPMMFLYRKKNLRSILKHASLIMFTEYWKTKYKKNIRDLLEVTKNRKVLTVSYHSKYSLITHFPELREEEVKVFYSPKKFINISFNDSLGYLKAMKLEEKQFFLMISADRWQKNNLRAVMAFDNLFTQNSDIVKGAKVVLTGVKDKQIFYRHIKNKDRFVLLNYIDADTLEALYCCAHAFVYPTLNEGFGYPPLEAMKYGTLSLCSAVTSVPEICGSAVLYFNPYDIEEIKNRILQSYDFTIIQSKKSEMKNQFVIIDSLQRESLYSIVSEILNG